MLEKWLTPSMFAKTDAIDEYTFMRTPGAQKRIRAHRGSFITEADFRWLAAQTITLVRIPVGYWLFDSIDGYTPTITYLDRAMKWAAKYNIKVLIDLHAVRGSQNGFDSSGRKGPAEWFAHKHYRHETIVLLERIATRYKNSPALWGIELVNEPTPGRHLWILRSFYKEAHKKLRRILQPETMIVFHDAFHPWFFMWTFRKAEPRILMDIHWYGFALHTHSLDTYLRQSAWLRKIILAILQLRQPVIIGEWSSVLPQRFFDAVPLQEHMALLQQAIVMQQQAYKKATGWVYWNYKAEGEGMWNFRSLVDRGIFTVST